MSTMRPMLTSWMWKKPIGKLTSKFLLSPIFYKNWPVVFVIIFYFIFIVTLYTQELWLAEKTWHLAQILVGKTERERDPLSLSLEVSIWDRIVVFFGLWFLPCSIPFDVTISSRSTTSLEWTFKSFVFKK